jgi:hypothetical protein
VPRGAGDVALRHHRVEDDEQVEINAPQIPFGYDLHILLSFLPCLDELISLRRNKKARPRDHNAISVLRMSR